MKRYVFVIIISVFIILFSIFNLWDAYRPHVGPVGNGPNDAIILRQFITSVIMGLCIMATGIIGIYNNKKKDRNEEVKITESQRVATIILLVLLSLLDIWFLIFTIAHSKLLSTEGRSLGIFIIMFFLLTSVIFYGFWRTFDSIKKEKNI
jgi:magnesium-transporting ATPase (P-type)